MIGDAVSLAGAILAFLCVLLLAYCCSRFLGKGFSKASSGRNMKVIEQLRLGTDKQLLILKVREHTYLIGVSQAGLQLLTELEGEFAEETYDDIPALHVPEAFQDIFREVLKNKTLPFRKDKEKMDE